MAPGRQHSSPSTPPRPAASAEPAGYSGTPLHRKLGVAPGHRMLVAGLPEGFPAATLNPDGAAMVDLAPSGAARPGGPGGGQGYQVVLLFCPDRATLTTSLPAGLEVTATAGRCWVAWPKRTSGRVADLTEGGVREAGLAAGWVDIKVCAVDAVWSALAFVRRRQDR